MSNVFKTVLLVALPASGKSEVREFMSQMDAARLSEEFHIGENLQLDDFPYVHMMRRIDEELEKIGEARIFYFSADKSFRDDTDWGMLMHLLNEDFADLKNSVRVNTSSEAMYLFDRFDRASIAVGAPPRMAELPGIVREKIAKALDAEAGKIRREKEAQYTESFAGKTIVIECARGGPDGSVMPLKDPFGYQYSLRQLSPEILAEAAILYIHVTPQESRRKNDERAHPEDPGSNLFHGVPMEVMLAEYGCDDMTYLREHSEQEHTITIAAHGKIWHLPVGVFDNRVDKTSFLRAERKDWREEDIAEVTRALKEATDVMWEHYPKEEA